jgi:hypothetical protein
MDAAAIIARLAEHRRQWVPLSGGLRVRIQRPAETDFGRFRAGVSVDHVIEYVDGWDGFTEASILGASQGSSDAVPFTRELWREIVRDRAEWVQPVAQAIVDAITAHLAARDAAAGN